MNIVKCKLCREPFHSYGIQVCPTCMEQIDKDFFVVRDYIYNNPGQANVGKIAEATEVKEEHIVFLLEEERLSVKGGPEGVSLSGGLKCQVCGRGISAGTLCDSCKSALTRELGVGGQSGSANKPGTYISPRSNR